MFDYNRSRKRAAVALGISLAVFVPALVIPRSSEHLTERTMLLVFSFAATLISAVWLLVRWDEAKRLTRLRSGQGILARWTIDPARWEWFRYHSSLWDQREGVRANDVDFTQSPGETGIEVVVTGDGILIGGAFTPLEKDVRITVRVDWIEFYQIIPKADGAPLHTVLRLPLQPGSETQASEVQQGYQRAYDAAKSSRRPMIYVLLLCFVGLPLITGLIWFIGTVTGWMK